MNFYEDKKLAERKYTYGTPYLLILGILLTVLKLADVIHWDWWIVLLPFYLPFVLTIAIILIIIVVVLLVGAVTGAFTK